MKKGIPPVETIPVSVPANYIDAKAIDKDLETFACLGCDLLVDGFVMRTPSLGVFSILETFDCKAIGDPGNANIEDWIRLLYVNHFRKECISDVQRWITDQGRECVRDALPEDQAKWHEWDRSVFEWGLAEAFFSVKVGESDESAQERMINNLTKISEWLAVCFTGFEMIPPSLGSGDSHVYGGVGMGGIISSIGDKMNVSYDDLIWTTPISLIGHVVASTARSNGMEGVARPKCRDDIKNKMKMARELQHQGKLMPWQVDHPDEHTLTDFQRKYYPELEKEMDALRKEKGLK